MCKGIFETSRKLLPLLVHQLLLNTYIVICMAWIATYVLHICCSIVTYMAFLMVRDYPLSLTEPSTMSKVKNDKDTITVGPHILRGC